MNYESENIRLTIPVTDERILIPCPENTETKNPVAFEAILENGCFTARIGYYHKDKPLELTGEANNGDEAVILFRPYKLELYINGELFDEQWCFGPNALSFVNLPNNLKAEYFEDKKTILPSVIGEFENAEGWRPGKNVFVGDCMPYSADGRYHVLYLYDRRHHASKWSLGAHQWAHISTADFKRWQVHPMAVPIDNPEEASICTGSYFEAMGKKYLFYAVRQNDFWDTYPKRARYGLFNQIRRSVSEDGYHFEKDKNFGFNLSDRYFRSSSRDPNVYYAGGKYHMMVTTSIMEGENEGHGCLAHLISDDLDNWTEAGEIFVSPDGSEPECSEMLYYHGKYYLIFSLPGAPQYLWTEDPAGEWHKPENGHIPCKSVPKGAVFEDKIVFTGFDGMGEDGKIHYAGQMTFRCAHEENGELIFD